MQGETSALDETTGDDASGNGADGSAEKGNGLANAVEAIKSPGKPLRFALKTVAFAGVFYIFILPLIPGFRDAADELSNVQPLWLIIAVAIQIGALYCYSLLTRAALADAGDHLSSWRLFRIQMSTKALSHVVPGGSAAGSALGYRLLTLSNVSGPDAGFALATAGLGSAVVLNLIFWLGLMVSIPIRGVNGVYATAALAGVVILMVVGTIVMGLLQGHHRAEAILRWVARRLRFDEHRAAEALGQIGNRLNDLVSNRRVLKRVVFWAAANWLLDAASLWVFIRAFGETLDPDALIVAFGLANVFAVIPITPGGLGIVEGVYIPTLTGFGLRRSVAALGVASYRIIQYFFPIVLGGILYLTLRVGPWRIERREELRRLRDLAGDDDETSETRIDFALRFGRIEVAAAEAEVAREATAARVAKAIREESDAANPAKPDTDEDAPPTDH